MKRTEFTAILALVLALSAPSAFAARLSPRVIAEAKGTPDEARVLKQAQRYEQSRMNGVDKIFSAFALDLAKYPRGGVAHRNVLVVLADFDADVYGGAVHHSAASTPGYYNKLLFSDDPNDGIVSMREFYRENSHGRLIISGRVTPDWLTMPHSYAYYTAGTSGIFGNIYPRSAQKLAEDAMAAAYGAFGNLSYFDNDGPDGIPSSGDDDGYIDATIVVHPGQGAEVAPVIQEDNLLWSHEGGIAVYEDCPTPSSPNCLPGIVLGNVRGFLYTLNGEYNYGPGDRANGTYLHEFGHTLGLADLYEQSICGNPVGNGLGVYSLMSLGNYLPLLPAQAEGTVPGNLDPWSRAFLGFEQPTVATGSGHYTLQPVGEGGSALKVWTNGQPGTEYFLIEDRAMAGSDVGLPGQGLLIYHIDDTMIDNCRDCDTGNCSQAPHGRVQVVQADGLLQLESPTLFDYGDSTDFFPGGLNVTSWTQSTTPSSRSYSGLDTGIRMTNITRNADRSVDFDLSVALQPSIQVTSVRVGDAAGNGNHILDNGENGDSLYVTITNAGTTSGALDLTLTSGDPTVTVVNGFVSTTVLANGASVTPTAFTVNVGTFPTLPQTVTFNLHWTDGTSSGDQTFDLSVGMGSGLSEGFESGPDGWTSSNVLPTVINEWHLSTTRAFAGATSMKVGSIVDPTSGASNDAKTYLDNEDDALISPMFDLPPNSQLVFESWMDAETNGGTMAFDGGRVEISERGGPWIPLAVDGGYDHQITFDSGATLRGEDVFSGSPQAWRRVVADLSAHKGPVQVRFRFSTNGGNQPFDFNSGELARYYEGWYVDAISVGPRVAPSLARKLTLRAGPNPFRVQNGFTNAMAIRFSAPDGLPHAELRPEVRIYDLRGRLVRTLTAAPDNLIASEFRASWNAQTEKGILAASGIYFARVDILGQTQTYRLVLLR